MNSLLLLNCFLFLEKRDEKLTATREYVRMVSISFFKTLSRPQKLINYSYSLDNIIGQVEIHFLLAVIIFTTDSRAA